MTGPMTRHISSSTNSHKALVRRIYRSILRATKPFYCEESKLKARNEEGKNFCNETSNMTIPMVLTSLLHRTALSDLEGYSLTEPLRKKDSCHLVMDEKRGKDVHGATNSESTDTDHHRIPIELARYLGLSYDEITRFVEDMANRQNIVHGMEENESDCFGTENNRAYIEDFHNSPQKEMLYKRLLREVIGEGVHMTFPSNSHQISTRMQSILHREFRDSDDSISKMYKSSTRRDAAFIALRELSKKLAWATSLNILPLVQNKKDNSQSAQNTSSGKYDNKSMINLVNLCRRQAAKDVSPLSKKSPKSYLSPGSFLVAHPLLSGYFSRTVIAILEHTDDDEDNKDGSTVITKGGTYGLVLNRDATVAIPGGDSDRRRGRALREVVHHKVFPKKVLQAFGDQIVREGGPANASIQMLYTCSIDDHHYENAEDHLDFGGNILSKATENEKNKENLNECIDKSANFPYLPPNQFPVEPNFDHHFPIYFGGDIMRAAQAVIDQKANAGNFSFIVGASCWESGQLEREIEKGYWLPCLGPPDIALKGKCEHAELDLNSSNKENNGGESSTTLNESRPKSDLWLSMMCALGEEEGIMAHLLLDNICNINGRACDDF
mmetsp:Transcript_7095/g.10167  ORF Transcript_7095/g.10167 Transcript_7095/m.10167 type:complete len:610 (+) Transcript_7095:61-1890(+)